MKTLNKVTIIGVGLIGGSFAQGIRKAGLASEIVGFGRNTKNLETAVDLGVIDSYTDNIEVAVSDSDLVFIAVPLGAMESIMTLMKPFLADKTIITDGGSAKSSVISAAKKVFGNLPQNFVPGHPIAGKEQSGVEAAEADLYLNHRVILTPTSQSAEEAVETVNALWSALGAKNIPVNGSLIKEKALYFAIIPNHFPL